MGFMDENVKRLVFFVTPFRLDFEKSKFIIKFGIKIENNKIFFSLKHGK